MDTVERSRCIRCRGTRHLILADGPPICRLCVYGWGWLARIVGAGLAIVEEPSSAELHHRLRHRIPVLACAFCRGRAARLSEA